MTVDLKVLRKIAEECNARAPGNSPQLEAFIAREVTACFAEIDRLRTALTLIRDSRQQGRLLFVESIEAYIIRVKEIARGALLPP